MEEMEEPEIYSFIIKDGESFDSIRQNAMKLRERIADERERRIHKLTQLDPDNKGRHKREAERIYEEKNRKIDTVLLQVADSSDAKLPLGRKIALGVTGSRKSANRLWRFALGVRNGLAAVVYVTLFVSTLFYFTVSSHGTYYQHMKEVYMIISSTKALIILSGYLIWQGVRNALDE